MAGRGTAGGSGAPEGAEGASRALRARQVDPELRILAVGVPPRAGSVTQAREAPKTVDPREDGPAESGVRVGEGRAGSPSTGRPENRPR